MIWNIIDNRRRPYRWREVNAIVEAVEHDNSCPDADQAPESDPAVWKRALLQQEQQKMLRPEQLDPKLDQRFA